jgi:hypothetical protein
MRRLAVFFAALSIVAVAAGCGGSSGRTGGTNVWKAGSVIHVGTRVDNNSLTKSVLGLGVGAQESKVRQKLGVPFGYASTGREICWAYHAVQGPPFGISSETGASPLDAIDFCMSPRHRVSRILLGIHG